MTRSQYIKERMAYWYSPRRTEGRRVILAERDAVAAEAAGVEWDPEEVAPPKKLQVIQVQKEYLRRRGGDSLPFLVPYGESWQESERNHGYLAAADAYNRLQAGELVERGTISELTEALRHSSDLEQENSKLNGRITELMQGCQRRAQALHRLAKEAGVSNVNGDEAVVTAVLEKLSRLAVGRYEAVADGAAIVLLSGQLADLARCKARLAAVKDFLEKQYPITIRCEPDHILGRLYRLVIEEEGK